MESSKLVVFGLVATTLYLIQLFGSTHAQSLTAVKCAGALPSGRIDFAILYDNDDSIYLVGGYNGTMTSVDDVIKYSISQDTTEILAQLASAGRGGNAVMSKFGNIFFLPGTAGSQIYQFFPDLQTFVNVSSFQYRNFYYATVVPDMDTALLFGGLGDSFSIKSLDLNTLESEEIGEFPEGVVFPVAIWVEEQDAAYIFNEKTVQKYFRSENRTEMLLLEVPLESVRYGLVWDGRFGYLIGQLSAGSSPAQSIVQFDPERETFAFIPVEGGYQAANFSKAVYVEKLNRIYAFGGIVDGGRYQDEIYYMDLDPSTTQPPPITKTTTTTEGSSPPTGTSTATTTTESPPPTSTPSRTTTRNPSLCPIDDPMPPPGGCPPQEPSPTYFPYPYNCRKFFQCSNGEAICMQCPGGTVWNQELRVCDRESEIGCVIVTTTVSPAASPLTEAQEESHIFNTI